jgi:predicted amidohydrolase
MSLEGADVYNAAGLSGVDGGAMGICHKTHLHTHHLQLAAGNALPVWPARWGPLGIIICDDRRWPEVGRVLRLLEARLTLTVSYGMHREPNEWWVLTRSYEKQCFIVFAHPEVPFIASPEGGLEAKLEEPDPDAMVCNIDLSRARNDNHIACRRPELYGSTCREGASPGGPECTS